MLKKIECNNEKFYFDNENLKLYKGYPDYTEKYTERDRGEKEKLDKLTIILTGRCNADCIYCYQRQSDDWKFDYESTFENIFEDLKKYNSINKVSFFGGEPLLKYELITKLVYQLENKIDVEQYEITTNGILLDEEKINFMLSKNFKIIISFDGPDIIQSKLRPICYQKKVIDNLLEIKNLDKNKIILNCTYTKLHEEMVSYNQLIEYFEGFGFKYYITPVFGVDDELAIERNYIKEIDMCINNLIKVDNNLTIESHFITMLNAICLQKKEKYFCDELNNSLTYLPNGKKVLCSSVHKSIENIDRYNLKENNICVNCWCRNFCTRCISKDLNYNKTQVTTECIHEKLYDYSLSKICELINNDQSVFEKLYLNYYEVKML